MPARPRSATSQAPAAGLHLGQARRPSRPGRAAPPRRCRCREDVVGVDGGDGRQVAAAGVADRHASGLSTSRRGRQPPLRPGARAAARRSASASSARSRPGAATSERPTGAPSTRPTRDRHLGQPGQAGDGGDAHASAPAPRSAPASVAVEQRRRHRRGRVGEHGAAGRAAPAGGRWKPRRKARPAAAWAAVQVARRRRSARRRRGRRRARVAAIQSPSVAQASAAWARRKCS